LQGLRFEDSAAECEAAATQYRARLRKNLWRSEPTFLNRADSRSGCQPHALEERAIKKSISVICVYHGEVSVAGEVCKPPEKCFQLSHRTRHEPNFTRQESTCATRVRGVSHADWKPSSTRSDPVALIEEADKGRIPQLAPLRHGHMVVSPFTFYRGAALNVAPQARTRIPVVGVVARSAGRSPRQFSRFRDARAGLFSTSMISTKRSRRLGSGTLNDLRRASCQPAAIMAWATVLPRIRCLAMAVIKRLPRKEGRIKQVNNPHATISDGLDELNNTGLI
jgi:hypothetical protein